MKVRVLFVALIALSLQNLYAQDDQRGLARKLLMVEEDNGFGGSVIVNLGQYFLGGYNGGDYQLLGAGLGIGISHKFQTSGRNPLEIGVYIAPQFSSNATDSPFSSLSAIVHSTFYRGLGIGIGYQLQSAQFTKPEGVFLTIGYSLMNEKSN